MFCKNCGSEIKSGTSFCANCGSPIENISMPTNQPQKKSNKIVGIVASLVVVAVLIVGMIAIIKAISGGGNYEEVAEKYALAEANFDYEEAAKYVAFDTEELLNDYFDYLCNLSGKSITELYEALEDEYDVSVDSMDDVFKCARLAQEEERREDYGAYTISVEIVDSKELSKSKLESLIDDYESGMGDIFDLDDYLDTGKIKKGYEVEVKVVIDGDEDYDSSVNTYTVIKYKGKWKVLKTSIPDL